VPNLIRNFTFLLFVITSATAWAQCRGEIDFPVLVVAEDTPVLDPGGPELRRMGYLDIAQASGFFSRFAEDGASEPPEFIPIDLGEGAVGLVDSHKVLTFRTSDCVTERLLMRDIPILEEEDIDNTLQAKAFIGLRDVGPQDVADGGTDAGISFRAGPRLNASVIATRKRYLLGYIFASSYDEESRLNWYLIGSEGDLNFSTNDKGELSASSRRSILGWINDRDMVIWPQRQALYPNGPKAFAAISADEELSPAGMENGAAITWIDESHPDRERAILKFSVLRRLSNAGVYSVAYPQPAVLGADDEMNIEGVPSEAPGPGAISDDDIRVVLDLLQDETQAIDVLFVLDNSESMEPYRKAIIEGIENVADLPAADRNTMRIAVSMFGDRFDNASDYKAWSSKRGIADPNWADKMLNGGRFQYWLMDLSKPGNYPTAEMLDRRFGGAYDDPRNDRPEAGLAALDLAMRTTNWSKDSVRLVVYIGDDVSRPVQDTDDNATQVIVAETIKKYNAVMLAINVAGRDSSDNSLWIDQVEALGEKATQIRGRGGVHRLIVAHKNAAVNDVDEARTAITETLGALFAIQRVADEQFNLERLCEVALENNISCNLAQDLLESLVGADISELQALELRTDLLKDGYYPVSDGALYVVLSAAELNSLRNSINTACIGMQRPSGLRSDLEDMVEELTEAFLGETRDRRGGADFETIPQFFGRLTNLPADYFGIFGNRTLDQFTDFVIASEDEPQVFRPIQQELCVSAELLDRVLTNSWAERGAFETIFDKDFQSYDVEPTTKLKRFDWRWGVGGGLQVYFVPQGFFPAALSK
jgi:hypothetical protein